MTEAMDKTCMEYVLKYMNPNLRSNLSRRCSTIRPIEESLVLPIQTLSVTPTSLQVNDITYNLGIIRHYPIEKTPESIQEINEQGGLNYDVDIYGIRYEPDVPETTRDPWNAGEGYRFPTNRISEKNMKLVNEEQKFMDRIEELQEELLVLQLDDPDMNRKRINQLQEELTPLYHRYKRTSPPFDHYMLLTILKNGAPLKIEVVGYTKLLPDAMKYLQSKVIGNRTLIVDTLRTEGAILDGLKIVSVKSLDIKTNATEVLNYLYYSLNPQNLFDSLEIHGDFAFKHPLVQTAQKLIFNDFGDEGRYQTMTTLKNRHVLVTHEIFFKEHVMDLIEFLMVEAEHGKCYQFRVHEDVIGEVQMLMEALKEVEGAKVEKASSLIFPNSILLPMANSLELLVDCLPDPQLSVDDKNVYNFRLKVQTETELSESGAPMTRFLFSSSV
ncbi:hypothetical protein GCK72_007787 [Caenorhabditis remanei]|uniref:DUF38 domain-containing protein n=1 Tax=Caenorhabditis remanei TaxID=31234 RepID=A0A6A5HIW7_CAERE|nr:hypothetical protein GCK72_007787 [Caenorhabditis remanei]KAF1767828.1 hypothetical protein GCK72_007787 [Caenorhabditis remanei]